MSEPIEKKDEEEKVKPVLETIIFSGGGLRGISYTGILKLLEEHNLRKDIKRIIGVSIGAMAALYILLGYSYEDVMDVLRNFSMKKVQDINVNTILKAPVSMGLDSGAKFIEFYKSLITAKGFPVDITLKQLYDRTKSEFIGIVTCIEDYKVCYMNHENEPDIQLWKLCVMSSNVPFIYPPIEHNGKHYVDGGIIDNFPLQYIEGNEKTSLAFVIIDNISGNQMSTPINYVLSIFKCYGHHLNTKKLQQFKKNTITINVTNVKFYEAEVTSTQLLELVSVGYESAKAGIAAFAKTGDPNNI